MFIFWNNNDLYFGVKYIFIKIKYIYAKIYFLFMKYDVKFHLKNILINRNEKFQRYLWILFMA